MTPPTRFNMLATKLGKYRFSVQKTEACSRFGSDRRSHDSALQNGAKKIFFRGFPFAFGVVLYRLELYVNIRKGGQIL